MPTEKYILDMTCGGRSIWFQKDNEHTIYFDTRYCEHYLEGRKVIIHPDVIGDFRQLPFNDETFSLVVFDPPHIIRKCEGWMTEKYGRYESVEEALTTVTQGISEGMRVLKARGVLIFKWSETDIPTSMILTEVKKIGYYPIFGHKSGKKSGTHWLTFLKE